MSLTKQYIDELHRRAEDGDAEAARTLEEAGLGQPEEGEEYPYYHPLSMDASVQSPEDLM